MAERDVSRALSQHFAKIMRILRSGRPWTALRVLQSLHEGLLDLLFPPRCAVCQQIGAPYLCDACIVAFPPLGSPVCRICGTPVPATEALRSPVLDLAALCGACRHQTQHHFTWARAAGSYDGLLREAIHRLKYDHRKGLGYRLGDWAHRAGGTALQPPSVPDLVVPVPLHWTRARQRGFNQSLLVAQGFVGQRTWPIATDALVRTRRTRPQVDLDADQRAANVANAFAVSGRHPVRGKRVLIVDDVLTTMHTVDECARVLKAAGAREVFVVAVAR